MEKEKISILNDEFDLSLAILIIRKNSFFILLAIFIGFGVAFFINRYTTPKYSASSVVKISEKNEVNQMMNFENIYETNLVAELSRLKSNKMLSEALKSLNLDVNYYTKGKFLNTENYQSNPFTISYQLKEKRGLNSPLIISFKEGIAIIEKLDDESGLFLIPVNKWNTIRDLELKINISNRKLNELNNSGKQFIVKIMDKDQLVKKYAEGLTVNIENSRANTIKISYKGNHPKKCADIANSLSSLFLISNISKKKESANQMIKFTNDQILKINQKLEYYQKLLQPYKVLKEDNQDLETNYNNLTFDLTAKDKIEKTKLVKNLNDFKKFYDSINHKLGNEEFYSILLLNSKNKYISTLSSKIRELLSEKRSLSFRIAEESYQVKELDFQINLETEDLIEITKNIIFELEEDLDLIEQRLNNYVVAKRTQELNFDHNTDYLNLQRMYEINSEYYSKLLTKKAEYEMVKAGFVSDNEIIEPAKSDSIPISPQKKSNYFILIGIGLIIGLLIVVLKYLLHNTVSSTADVSKHTENIPILGMVPSYKDVIPVSQLIVDKNPKSLMSEAFRSIRSNMQFISQNEGSKIITVTSTISGEGKTFVAINLGGIIAFSEKRVIILDLDMRKPKTHIGFNVQNTIGMSTLLIGKSSLEDCIQKSHLENLHFITAGPIPPNPAELIINHKMSDVINELKKSYDIIVIDTPPVGIVTDALPIISKVDYPIYIVRAHFSKKIFLKNIQMLKDKKNIRNLSVILNSAGGDVKYGGFKKYGYGYGYGHGYGYGGDHGYYEEKPKKEKKILKNIFTNV